MGKAEGRAKDAAMAASLLRSNTHRYEGVAAHKRSRLNALFASLAPSQNGSAAYRRMRQR